MKVEVEDCWPERCILDAFSTHTMAHQNLQHDGLGLARNLSSGKSIAKAPDHKVQASEVGERDSMVKR